MTRSPSAGFSGRLADPAVEEAIERLAGVDRLTIFAGAGVGMEVGLPSWRSLVLRLVKTIVASTESVRNAALDSASRDRVVRQAADATIGQGPIAAASAVKAFRGADFVPAVQKALYLGRSPTNVWPGPTALALARLWRTFSDPSACRVLTTNFDLLIELAMGQLGETAVPASWGTRSTGWEVDHLHGVLDHRGSDAGTLTTSEIVLAEDEFYSSSPDAKARLKRCVKQLQHPSLLVGTSLTDPNLLRYLQAASKQSNERFLVSVTQPDGEDLPDDLGRVVLDARRDLARERLHSMAVVPVDVDYFAQASLFVAEVARRREARQKKRKGRKPVARHDDRMRLWSAAARGAGLYGGGAFGKTQQRLRRSLSAGAASLSAALQDYPPFRASDEFLALHLWTYDADGDDLVLSAQSDRRFYDPGGLQRFPVQLPTDRLVVEAFCNGTAVAADGAALHSSRWGSMVALPVRLSRSLTRAGQDIGQLYVGVVVIASTARGPAGLDRLDAQPEQRAQVLAAVRRGAAGLLGLRWAASATSVPGRSPTSRRLAVDAPRLGSGTKVLGAIPDELAISPAWKATVRAMRLK